MVGVLNFLNTLGLGSNDMT